MTERFRKEVYLWKKKEEREEDSRKHVGTQNIGKGNKIG